MSKIFAAMNAAMADIDPIAKGRQNSSQGYAFRGIDDVYNEIQSILVKHKIFTIPNVLDCTREERVTKSGTNMISSVLKISYKFYAEDGSFVDVVVIGEGMDSGDKASNKGMSAAHKYALIQAFCIPTKDEKDPEADTDPEDSKPKNSSGAKPAPANIGSYVIQVMNNRAKTMKGKRISDCDMYADLVPAVDYWAKSGKKLEGKLLEDFQMVEAFLKSRETKKDESSEEEIPF